MTEINTDNVFKDLKKQNGESVARVIRDALLLDVPNIVHLLEFAGRNPEDVRQLIPVISSYYKKKHQTIYTTDKDPLELLDEAGYYAFVVKTEKQKDSIRKYFRPDEELCTFKDSTRHENYYIIHAIKKEVIGDERRWHIKPSGTPARQDPYGTSVISIQIAKPNGGFISIKNRYNHTVINPDATFNNNPDDIIKGLTYSLQKYFNVSFNVSKTPLPDNYRLIHDQYVHFDYEINNTYFDQDYYFSGSTITKLKNDASQILFYRGFLLDLHVDEDGNGKIYKPHIFSLAGVDVDFCKELDEYIQGKTVRVTVAKDKTKTVLLNGERFMDIKNGIITFIHAPNFNTIDLNSHFTKLSGDLDFSGVELLRLHDMDLANVTSIKLNPKGHVDLKNVTNINCPLDFSGFYTIDLINATFTDKGQLVFGDFTNLRSITLKNVKNLRTNLDFSTLRNSIDLKDVDLSQCGEIKIGKCNTVNLQNCVGIHGTLDLSNVYYVGLFGADLSSVKKLILPKHPYKASSVPNIWRDLLDLREMIAPHGILNLSHIENETLDFSGADLSRVTDLMCPKSETDLVIFSNAIMPKGRVQFGVATKIYAGGANFSNTTEINFGSVVEECNLEKAVGLHGCLDFSNIKEIKLTDADLSKVTSIKFRRGAIIYGLKPKDRLRFALVNGVEGIKTIFAKKTPQNKNAQTHNVR